MTFRRAQEQDSYIAEKWFVRDRLNLVEEALAQLDALMLPDVEYEEGKAGREARERYVAERLRLLYVGITRAKRELFVTWNTGHQREAGARPGLPGAQRVLGAREAQTASAEQARPARMGGTAMTTAKIDEDGRVTLPPETLDRLGLRAGRRAVPRADEGRPGPVPAPARCPPRLCGGHRLLQPGLRGVHPPVLARPARRHGIRRL